MALDLLPFSGAQIMEKKGALLEAFFLKWKGEIITSKDFPAARMPCVYAVCLVVFDSL